MDDQNKNLILATALSFVVILIWFVLFPPPEQVTSTDQSEISATEANEVQTPSAAGTGTAGEATATAEETLPEGPSTGELLLVGGRVLLARGFTDMGAGAALADHRPGHGGGAPSACPSPRR